MHVTIYKKGIAMRYLGSHNSFTYLKPSNFLGKVLRFTAKCQEVDVFEQYKLGVRVFDLRIRQNKHGRLTIAHGVVEYAGSQEELNDALMFFNERGDVHVRVMLETRTKVTKSKEQEEWFVVTCKMLEKEYENIHFYGGHLTSSNIRLYKFKGDELSSCGYHASVDKTSFIDDAWPYLYARKHNDFDYARDCKYDVKFMDFVNLGCVES